MSDSAGEGSQARLVCFDLGGVVVRICRSWAEGCTVAGVTPRDTASAPAGDLERLHVDLQSGRIDPETWASSVSDAFEGAYSPDEVRRVHDAWLLGEYAGVAGLIERLHALGFSTAALSNTNRSHWERLEELEAVGRLHHHVVSHEVGLCKPDPGIYRALETRTGFRGAAVHFFDDLPENIEAARTAGWRAQRIDPRRETAPQMEEALRAWGIG